MELNTLSIPQSISQELLSLNVLSREITKPVTVDQIKHRSIEKEFKLLNLLFSSKGHKEALEDSKTFKRFNRYKDILPYKDNIVTLNGKTLDASNYIHANWISNPFSVDDQQRDFIATQGPLETTCESFWQMILYHDCKVVIAIIEDMLIGKKCWKYWTDKRLVFGRIYVECLYIEKHELYDVRTLKITDNVSGITTIISHYHLKSWYDKTAPDESDFKAFGDFLKLMYKLKKADEDTPIVVNCSAGVGRTGTLIGAYFLFESFIQAKENGQNFKFSVFETVRGIREQRAGAINVIAQYEFLYNIVQYFTN